MLSEQINLQVLHSSHSGFGLYGPLHIKVPFVRGQRHCDKTFNLGLKIFGSIPLQNSSLLGLGQGPDSRSTKEIQSIPENDLLDVGMAGPAGSEPSRFPARR